MSASKQATPDLSHLNSNDYEHIYEPSDDTFLLLDALEKDKAVIAALNPAICIEVGYDSRADFTPIEPRFLDFSSEVTDQLFSPGSGCVITFLAQMMGPSHFYMAVDINRRAAYATTLTAKKNQISVEVINSNLLSPLKRLSGLVDLVIFNPPYVPTPEEELGHTDIVAAWAGGAEGTAALDQLMPQLDEIISPKGCFYCVVLAQNKPNEVAKRMRTNGFPFAKVILKQQCIGELLYIIRFSRVSMEEEIRA